MTDTVDTSHGTQADADKTSPSSRPAPASATVDRQHEHAQEPSKCPMLNDANARHDNTPSAYGQSLAPSCCDCGSCCADCLACACADDSRCNVASAPRREEGADGSIEDGAADQSYRQHGGGD